MVRAKATAAALLIAEGRTPVLSRATAREQWRMAAGRATAWM